MQHSLEHASFEDSPLGHCSAGHSRPQGAAPHVLLVEDEFLISAATAQALAEHGFDVHTAASAAAAFRHLSAGAPIDVLFTDIALAGGENGEAVARRARALRPGLPVVYASGNARGVADPVPGSTFIPKPYAMAQVCSMLARIIGATR
jgi:DNA-binding NtrC family response regulator